jgi:cell division protein FtsI (penicillin-binding protein 3)
VIEKGYKLRYFCVYAVFALAFACLYYRLFVLQIIRHEELFTRAQDLHRLNLKIDPRRGKILDCSGKPLAMSVAVQSAYAVPGEISGPHKTARLLAPLVKLSYDELVRRFEQPKKFVWVERKLDEDTYRKVKNLNLDGIGFREEVKRMYPRKELLAHLVGFVDIDNNGLEGVERVADEDLRGQAGWRASYRDRKGREIITLRDQDVPAVDGYDIVLTVDMMIQHIAESALDAAFRGHHARGGCIVVMNPKTGAILAMANRPTFDPNHPAEVAAEWRRNRCITDIYEPGSTFKVISVATALDAGVVGLGDKFYCENGAFRVHGHTLHDVHGYEYLTTAEIVKKSSNIGAVKIAMTLGEKPLYQGIKRFGFGNPTGVSLPGEVGGIFRPVEAWSPLSLAAIPMGHELGVTPIQMAAAIAAVANGGIAMRPYVIAEVRDGEGMPVKRNVPEARGRVLREEAARSITAAMAGVISRDGTGRRAMLEEYTAAGKTGTSQKVDENGRYSHSRFIGSFVGFAPVSDPEILVLVVLDEPHPNYYGGLVAAPVFQEVATKSLKYLGVAPDRENPRVVAAGM